jgi:hypothetical protein
MSFWSDLLKRLSAKSKPAPVPPATTFHAYFDCEPTAGVTASLMVDDGSSHLGAGQQHITFENLPMSIKGWGGWLTVSAEGYTQQVIRVSVVDPLIDDTTKQPVAVQLKSAAPPMPAIPTRDQKGLAKLHFGGLYFNHSAHGRLPLFDACFAWLNAEDRAEVYRVKHEAGDTHLLVQVPFGIPLYDEPGQPYNGDNFPAKGYDPTEFYNAIKEAIQNGMIPVIFMSEDYDQSCEMIVHVIKDLSDPSKVDLVPYCIFSPGWDGIFYGWEPSHEKIPHWGALARIAYKGDQSNLMLFLEFNPGHIPLGEGDADYKPGGDMKDFDIIAGEFSPWMVYGQPAGDEVWQIVSRMACPNGYNRPPEQPAGDDPNPPYVLHDCARGRRYGWVFETGVYEFVRDRITPAVLDKHRAYYRNLGCEVVC